jgi:hypothetical protein
MRVLGDDHYELFHVEQYDEGHSEEEDRYITTGSDPYARDIVLVIVWTDREQITRIISARSASRFERKDYETEIAQRQDRPHDG